MDAAPPERTAVLRGRSWLVSGWLSPVSVSVLVLLAGSGAATHPGGASIGVPSLSIVLLAALAGSLVRFSMVRGLGPLLLPAVAAVASVFANSWSSLLLFSGPPLFALALSGLVLSVVALGRKPQKAILLPAFLALYAAVAYQAQTNVGPDGDEPQYLMVTESILQDHDLLLDQDFKEARYSAFFSRHLDPHFRIRGPQGQIYSLHAVGLSILILPAYALGGYASASFFMALLAAFLIREIRRLAQEVSGDDALAEGTAWIVGLSPPIIHFAGLIFTEIPAALLLAIGIRTAVFGRTARASMVAALCVAALPWLNVRYAILSAAVFGALVWRLMREGQRASGLAGLKVALIPAVSALGIGLYHFALWGFFDPRRVYGQKREFSLDVLPEGLPGLFFDQEFGLFVYAPIFALSISGFVHLWRRHRTLALAGLFAAAGVIATASVWPMWRGGFNPPSRFLVPLVPVLAAGVALALQGGIRPATALLAGWSLWCGLSGALNIETIHRDRDGLAPFFRSQSGAREWTAALPSFVLAEDRPTRVKALPWALLLLLPIVSVVRRAEGETRATRSREMWLAVASLMAVAAWADRMSPRVRSPERDATRLLGSPSLQLPRLQFVRDTVAEWPVDFVYEPHRVPDGLLFARQIRLMPGTYELTLTLLEGLSDSPPGLRVTNHRTGQSVSQPLRAENSALAAIFTIVESAEVDLYLVGGDPQTFSRAKMRRLAN